MGYKQIATNLRFLAVDLDKQLLPDSFEPTLNYRIDHEIDLKPLDARYRNELTEPPRIPRICCSRWRCLPTVGASSTPAETTSLDHPSRGLDDSRRHARQVVG